MENLYDILINKGFERYVYENQNNKVFYRRDINSNREPELLTKLYKATGEDLGYFEGDLENIICTVEITEDFNFAQYLFTEKKLQFGGEAHDELTIEEFKELLKLF